MIKKEDIEKGEMEFAVERVYAACGQIATDKGRFRVWTVMQAHPSTSLVIVTYKGNSLSGRVSKVTFNLNYKKDIMEELQSLAIALNPDYLDELDAKSNNSVDIDVASLASFLEATRDAISRSPNKALDEKLTRDLLITNALIDRAKEQDGIVWVDEYWEQIDSGRIHGHGLSLQRVSKEVRHAALGPCHRYDFKACSFALMTDLALSIDPTLKVAALKDYVKQRAVIRKRIAGDIGISEEWMKTVFTSLGFGAELKDNPFNSIRGKLGHEKFAALMANTEFALIASALKQVSDTIHKHFPNAGFELCGRTYKPVDKDGKKRNKNQKLAWIYQCMESHALGIFTALIPENYKVKLLVHDCIYTEKRLPAQHIADIKWKLSNVYPTLNFEHDEIFPIHAAKDHGKKEREQLAAEYAHKQFIAQQEEIAKDYVPVLATVDGKPVGKRQVQTPWGLVDADLYEPHQKVTKEDSYFKDGY